VNESDSAAKSVAGLIAIQSARVIQFPKSKARRTLARAQRALAAGEVDRAYDLALLGAAQLDADT
jgi:hypothetical protein